MIHQPPKRLPFSKMWKHIYFFVVIMMFIIASQPAFAMNDSSQDEEERDPYTKVHDILKNKKLNLWFQNDEQTESKIIKAFKNKDNHKYVKRIFEIAKESPDLGKSWKEYPVGIAIRISKQMIDIENEMAMESIIDEYFEEEFFHNNTRSNNEKEEMIRKAFLENDQFLKNIVRISNESPSLETEYAESVGIAIRVSKKLDKSTTGTDPKYSNAVSNGESNNDAVTDHKSNNFNATDQKWCKYFTIVLCIIIIVIVVVILFSENDEEEEEAKKEDEENPNTPADIEESLSQDLGNSESIKHAIDNMNVVHKGNKVDQIASSHEKIDVDGLFDVNETVEEVHVSE